MGKNEPDTKIQAPQRSKGHVSIEFQSTGTDLRHLVGLPIGTPPAIRYCCLFIFHPREIPYCPRIAGSRGNLRFGDFLFDRSFLGSGSPQQVSFYR